MKIRLLPFFLIIVSIFGIVSLQNCDLLGVTKEQRISFFTDDLNLDPIPNSVQSNFSPSCTIYDTIDGTLMRLSFPSSSIPYTVYNLDLDSNPATGTISGTGGTFGGPWSIEFTMVKDGNDWLILELWVESLGIIVN
jgi:hypothetical protein